MSKNTSKEPEGSWRNYSHVSCHGTPWENSRRPHLWHQRWYNTVLMKHKYVSQLHNRKCGIACVRSAASERRLAKTVERARPCWHQGLLLRPTAIWKRFSSLSHAPSGFTKAATTTYTALGTLLSIFYKAGPKSGPLQTQQSGLNLHPSILKQTMSTEYIFFIYIYTLSLLLEAELTVAEQFFTEFQSKDFVMVECCSGWSSSSWRAAPDSFDLLRLFWLKENPNNQGCLRIVDFEGGKKKFR